MSRKQVSLIVNVLLCIVLLCFLVLSFKSSVLLNTEKNRPSQEQFYTERIQKVIQNEGLSYKLCITTNLGKGVHDKNIFWQNLKPAIETCVKQTKFRNLPINSYENKDETKNYLHDENMHVTKSVVLTLGVGKDVTVESKLKELLSVESEFFAADPMLVNDALFSPIGLFFPFAVGNITGITNASVLTAGYNKYETLQMMHIDIMTFLTNIIRRKTIDMFLMDNEGPEYDIQPMMASGGNFDEAGITVCQINGEYHGGYLPQLHSVLLEVFNDVRFIPLRIVQGKHVRLFMINIDSPYCVNRYLASHFSKRSLI